MLRVNLYRPRSIVSILITGVLITGTQALAEKLDLNLQGGTNLNLNNANNNKMTTPLKSFVPTPVAPGQIDLMPAATPPVTSTVTSFYGGWVNTDIVDPDYPNAVAAKAISKSTGLYVGKLPEIASDQPIKPGDVETFLKDYHKYLRDEGLESSSDPETFINETLPVLYRVKKKSALPSDPKASVELLATQEKLEGKLSPDQANEKAVDSH